MSLLVLAPYKGHPHQQQRQQSHRYDPGTHHGSLPHADAPFRKALLDQRPIHSTQSWVFQHTTCSAFFRSEENSTETIVFHAGPRVIGPLPLSWDAVTRTAVKPLPLPLLQ